ncbi:MAG: hypothetical protein JOZ52_03315 [Acidobacteria bacterium]|nr:hypothetical protein [Acidobacteriota bacterium]
MMKIVLKDMTETARGLWSNRRALLLFFATYVALLATLALFIMTREATVKEVLITLATLVATPALFFLLQGMCVSFAEDDGAFELLRRAMKIFWRLILASLPLIIVWVALYLLLGKIEARLAPRVARGAAQAQWPLVIISTVRLLVFGLVLPLLSIHLWLALLRADVRSVLRDIAPLMSRAFAPRSVLTYVCGLVLFGVVPYLLIASRTPFERAWLELTVLGARLVLAFALMLVGWVVTVGAIRRGMSAQG